MALFNVTRHGLADPFEWSSQPHPPVRIARSAESPPGPASLRKAPSAAADDDSWRMRRPSQGDEPDAASGPAEQNSRQSTNRSPRSSLVNARPTQRPKSTRSAAIRASQVPDSEGLVLPPVPGALPPINTRVRGNTATAPKTLQWKPAHNGSHQKFLELRTKHRLNKQGPNDVCTPQLTTAHDYGRWLRTCMPQDEPWVLERRRGINSSEVTKFVDEMAKTNRDFQLF